MLLTCKPSSTSNPESLAHSKSSLVVLRCAPLFSSNKFRGANARRGGYASYCRSIRLQHRSNVGTACMLFCHRCFRFPLTPFRLLRQDCLLGVIMLNFLNRLFALRALARRGTLARYYLLSNYVHGCCPLFQALVQHYYTYLTLE